MLSNILIPQVRVQSSNFFVIYRAPAFGSPPSQAGTAIFKNLSHLIQIFNVLSAHARKECTKATIAFRTALKKWCLSMTNHFVSLHRNAISYLVFLPAKCFKLLAAKLA